MIERFLRSEAKNLAVLICHFAPAEILTEKNLAHEIEVSLIKLNLTNDAAAVYIENAIRIFITDCFSILILRLGSFHWACILHVGKVHFGMVISSCRSRHLIHMAM